MVSRVRIEAYGANVDECKAALYEAAEALTRALQVEIYRGQEVYERNLGETPDSAFSYQGRLILHPNIARGDKDGELMSLASKATEIGAVVMANEDYHALVAAADAGRASAPEALVGTRCGEPTTPA